MIPAVRLQILVVVLIRVVYSTMYRMVYPFLGEFGRGLGVGLPELSQALMLRSLAGGVSPLLAFLADSRGRRIGMLLGLGMVVVGAGVLWIWPGYAAFVLCMVLGITGYHIFVPSMQAYLGDHVEYRRRALALALTELGWSLSFILGVPFAGWMIVRFGWNSPFPLVAVLTLVGMIVLARLIPAEAKPIQGHPRLWSSLGSLLRSPLAWLGLGFSICLTAANEVINLVFGLWLDQSFGLKVTALGAMAVAIGFMELGGEALVGGLVDRVGKLPAIVAGTLLNCLASLALIALGGGQWGAILALLLFYLTFEFTLVSSLPLMTELFPAARATLMALNIAMFAVGRIFGTVLGAELYTSAPAPLASNALASNALASVGLNLLGLVCLVWLWKLWQPADELSPFKGQSMGPSNQEVISRR
jgi:predicted MFS family arabinose efflux permease